MEMNKDQIDVQFNLRSERQGIKCFDNGQCEVRKTIKNKFKSTVFRFFERLFELNESRENPKFFQNIMSFINSLK